jgi:ADP-dependent NAD(P)H-hydrate dehydratase
MTSTPEQVTPAVLREWPLPDPGESKHSRGHVVVIGGAVSTPGAVLLAGVASLRVGAGVLAMAVPEPVATALAIAVPEAAVIGWSEPADHALSGTDRHRLERLLGQANAVVLGPGLHGVEPARTLVAAVAHALPAHVPIVIDAYALGVLPDLPAHAAQLAGRAVLTPNQNEAGYLLDVDAAEVGDTADPTEIARAIAERWQAVVSFQGAVARPDGWCHSVSAGHPGLGTSGSGDVLAGAIGGLLARGADPAQAACWGTYVHAAAGDRLAAQVGRLGFLAREILEHLPLVLTEVQA